MFIIIRCHSRHQPARHQMQEHTIEALRQGILSDSIEEKRATARAFRQLAKGRFSQFLNICHTLLKDPDIKVRQQALRLLGWYGDRDDLIAEAAAQEALSIPELEHSALLALGAIGTDTAVPLLFEYAKRDLEYPAHPEQHHRIALWSLAKRVRTAEQKQEALALARESLLSEHYPSRDAALRALKMLSTAAAEEDLLLKAYRVYADELVAWALGAASPRMLPILYELLAELKPGCAEHGDIAHAIQRMKTRIEQGEEADPGKHNRVLSEYL